MADYSDAPEGIAAATEPLPGARDKDHAPERGDDDPAVRARIPRPEGARRIYAALDLGTNNCRLLIARANAEGDGGFTVVDAFSRIVRLGEGLMQTGNLAPAAMDRAAEALAACSDKLARRGVSMVRSVATEAVRRADNGPAFVARIYRETGIALDVITPAEEARLAVLGCQTLLDRACRRSLVFDIGGGSTEVALLERREGERRGGLADFRMRSWISVPWGVVSLAETEAGDAGSPIARMEAYARMKARVAERLRPLHRRIGHDVQLLGASGTVTTLASLHMGLTHYDRRRVDGAIAPTGEMRALAHNLAARSPAERARIPGIGAERADLVVAGCAILEALMDLAPVPTLQVADRGLREGILRGMIARDLAAQTQAAA